MLQITLNQVSHTYSERKVFDGINLSLESGARLLVRGPNGSGKTTLLKILAGLLTPSSGTLEIKENGEVGDAAWGRRWTGYLSPELTLYDELSSLENLEFFARMRGLPGDAAPRNLLERVGLGGRMRDPIGTLSTGLRQRAKLAFALQPEPKLLLLDEPGSNLDADGRSRLDTVLEAADSQSIVVMATNEGGEPAWGTDTLALG